MTRVSIPWGVWSVQDTGHPRGLLGHADAVIRSSGNMLALLQPPTKRLADGTVGYYTDPLRTDECWAATVATCLQIPKKDVPDWRIDERLNAGESPEEIARSSGESFRLWLASRGLRMIVHRKLPVTRRRWIGIVPMQGWFSDHCLVMSRGEVLFDPIGDGGPFRRWIISDVRHAVSFGPNRKGTA